VYHARYKNATSWIEHDLVFLFSLFLVYRFLRHFMKSIVLLRIFFFLQALVYSEETIKVVIPPITQRVGRQVRPFRQTYKQGRTGKFCVQFEDDSAIEDYDIFMKYNDHKFRLYLNCT
jgi:hypothetical protein